MLQTQSTKFQLFDLIVYTVWACLKGVTPQNTFKEESTNKHYYDDNYSAPFACRSFAFSIFDTYPMTYEGEPSPVVNFALVDKSFMEG